MLELYYQAGDPGPEPPDRIAVTITHDGVIVLDESFAPDYELAEPKEVRPRLRPRDAPLHAHTLTRARLHPPIVAPSVTDPRLEAFTTPICHE